MDQVRVNLTLEQEVWGKFTRLVPKREKSRIINALLKNEIIQRERRLDEQRFAEAFREGAQDEERLKAIQDWELMDEVGKVYPFEVFLPSGTGGLDRDSKIMLDQIRSVDKKRLIRRIGRLEKDVLIQASTIACKLITAV